jgi:hypothetical protein
MRGPFPAPQTVVVRAGRQAHVGPAEVRLEDGTTITVDDRLPRDLPAGYHQILRDRGQPARLIAAPVGCHVPDGLSTWGWAIQLYAARSRRSWGIGDLSDLRSLGRWARGQEAGIALINPLAAVAPTLPQQASPYFPSSRRFRSPLYLRIEEVDGASETDGIGELARAARRLNRDRLIDRDRVFELKSRALEAIWRRVRKRASGIRQVSKSSPPSVPSPSSTAPAGGCGRPICNIPSGRRSRAPRAIRRSASESGFISGCSIRSTASSPAHPL